MQAPADAGTASTLEEVGASVVGELPGEGKKKGRCLGGVAVAALVEEDGETAGRVVGGADPGLQGSAGRVGLGQDVVDQASPLGEAPFDVAGTVLEDGARPAVVAFEVPVDLVLLDRTDRCDEVEARAG
jgi:hypothetical protein